MDSPLPPTPTESQRLELLNRRSILIGALGLGLAACTSTGSADDQVDEIVERLDTRLAALATNEAEVARFEVLVARIREDAERLLRQHEAFTSRLLADSRDHDVEAAELREFVLDAARVRRDLRRRILSHQGELKLALGESRWPEVVAGLNDADAMGRVVGRRL